MIRIISFSLLTLMLSCSNTCPDPATESEEQTTTQTGSALETDTTTNTTPLVSTTKKEAADDKKVDANSNKKGDKKAIAQSSNTAKADADVKAAAKAKAAKAKAKADADATAKAKAKAKADADAKSKADAKATTAATPSETPTTEAASTTKALELTTVVTTTPLPDTKTELVSIPTSISATAATASTATYSTSATSAAEMSQALVPTTPQSSFTKSERRKQRFLPTRRRIDREINKIKFAYKGEVTMGLTASYGTLTSDNTDFMLIIDNIKAEGTIATVKPFLGYFYRDNNCVGLRFGYQHIGGKIDGANINLGESNDITMAIPYIDMKNNNYSFGLFHRSYAGLDPKGRFGLFAEFELSLSTGSSEFAFESGNTIKRTYSDNTKVALTFNPGAAVYIFPNVCATLSFGLGGLQYTSVTQKDPDGNKVGTRQTSNMKFKLNIAAINIGMNIHLWDKKKK